MNLVFLVLGGCATVTVVGYSYFPMFLKGPLFKNFHSFGVAKEIKAFLVEIFLIILKSSGTISFSMYKNTIMSTKKTPKEFSANSYAVNIPLVNSLVALHLKVKQSNSGTLLI